MDVTKFVKNQERDAWYKIPDSNVEVHIKQIPNKKVKMFSKDCMKVINPGISMQKEIDEEKLNKVLLNEAVLGWKNIEMDGKPFPCTRENKIILDESWEEFRTLWNNVVVHEKNMESLLVEEERKN